MAIYTIGDLHLSFSSDKPMDIFGENWTEHYKKIKADWITRVSNEDTVIIPGDISWASSLEEAMVDLKWIDDLPGKKLLLRGNHDYWWSTLTKMRKSVETIDFIQNNHYEVEGKIICGTRGWICPNDSFFTKDDEKIFIREVQRLKLSLGSIKDKDKEIIMFTHFPPFNDKKEKSELMEIFEEYNVKHVYYGHVHNTFNTIIKGKIGDIEYDLVSCDYLDFKLKKIL